MHCCIAFRHKSLGNLKSKNILKKKQNFFSEDKLICWKVYNQRISAYILCFQQWHPNYLNGNIAKNGAKLHILVQWTLTRRLVAVCVVRGRWRHLLQISGFIIIQHGLRTKTIGTHPDGSSIVIGEREAFSFSTTVDALKIKMEILVLVVSLLSYRNNLWIARKAMGKKSIII